jgi:hypothetical protein
MVAVTGLVILSPLFVAISVVLLFLHRGNPFFCQRTTGPMVRFLHFSSSGQSIFPVPGYLIQTFPKYHPLVNFCVKLHWMKYRSYGMWFAEK